MFSETFFDILTERELRDLASRPAIRPASVARPLRPVAPQEPAGPQGRESVWGGVPGALFGLVTWLMLAVAVLPALHTTSLQTAGLTAASQSF